MKAIPRLDLNDFLSSEATQKQAFVEALGRAFEEIGFVILKGHLLTENTQAELYHEVRAFFALPQNVKQRYEIEGLAGQRGYTSFGKESAKGRNEGDLKEFWHFGQYRTPPDGVEYPPNLAVEDSPALNKLAKKE